ncbi:MAG: zinc dependent phospholipase C family protein [Nitrospirae bacterium]|nr:zinc dependent phospholipase C family protein [Nitrospirota bacterium]
MPGSYAHITLVNEASEKRRLKKMAGFPIEAIDAAGLHAKFLELGCISPDYPYLDITSADSKKWADAMHYAHTGQAIFIGAELVRALPAGIPKDKCLAWLMGYTAHVVTDMCIHPVVELKVGPYKGNETPHRRCEMHQDAYIFSRMGTGMPQTAQHIRSTILKCGDQNDPECLDPDVKNLWEELLRKVHPEIFNSDMPDLDKWHKRCYNILEQLLPTSGRLIGFARHACNRNGLLYPTPEEIEMGEYIDNLRVPSNAGRQEMHMHYDMIFDWATEQVQKVWLNVTQYALGESDSLPFYKDEWDLDTGRNKSASAAPLVFWEVA